MLLCILLSLLAAISVTAYMTLPTFVANHMVLQREPFRARLWGWTTTKGANVTIQLDNHGVVAFGVAAGEDGYWQIELPAQPASVNHVITISDRPDGSPVLTLDDIAFGDVFLCSGQSNMELSVSGAFNASAEIADSANYPGLRYATVQLITADTPQMDAPSKSDYAWSTGPAAMGTKGLFDWPSASCYFFGREIYKKLGGTVPVGLVTSCWGGQQVECFSSPDALADETCGGTRPRPPHQFDTSVENPPPTLFGEYNSDTPYLKDGPKPTQLWNAMIHPFLLMRFVAATWYQGEANAGQPESYACRFPAMITDWRKKFDLPNMGFYYVQLAAFAPSDFSLIRAAQNAALLLPNVGVAAAIDIGDPTGPAGPIHPRRKQEVGRRLALNALAISYGQEEIGYKGPTLTAVQRTPTGAILGFAAETTHGFHLGGTAACAECCNESPFEVLDSSTGNWTRATASVVSRDTVKITATDDFDGIRFNWEGYPQCALYNGQGGPDDHTGLPTLPFEWCANPTGENTWTGKACGAKTLGDSAESSQLLSVS